jgi:hypothetical protein
LETPNDHAAPVFVQFGTVLAGAERFSFNNNVNAVYRGMVRCRDGSMVMAFLKDIPLRQFANELLAAVIGLRLGLPIPRPIVALVSPDVIPAIHNPLAATEDFIVFGSADAGSRPILQVLRDAGAAAAEIFERLSKWSQLGELYGFDTWIANVDRHRGNLLFGGRDEVWLIDHGHSFTGPDWTAGDLAPGESLSASLVGMADAGAHRHQTG